ncbi:MAG: hypothetical protein RR922_07125 [Clostridia bacterium]
MNEELKKIIFMGLGAMSLTSEKAIALKKDLETKGEEFFEKGKVLNEELKHDISEKLKENVTITVEKKEITVDDMLAKLDDLSETEKAKIQEKLRKNNDDQKK